MNRPKSIESNSGVFYPYPETKAWMDWAEQQLEAAEKVYRLGTSLSASAAKDEDESGSILGYVLYVPPWLLYDFNMALAAFEEKDDE